MQILKLLTGAAVLAAPISMVSAQSGARADSSANPSHRGWLAGAGAAAGAGLFLAFTKHGDARSGSVSFHDGAGTPSGTPGHALTPSPAGGSSPSSPGSAGDDPTDSSASGSSPAGVTSPTDSAQSNDKFLGPQSDGPKGPSDDAPSNDDTYNPGAGDSSPHGDMTLAAAETSTVPEPGSLALTATGIIGLLPLVRRRK